MLIKEEIYIDIFDTLRTLHIYLPDNLKEDERCQVIYMFDGHNLFLDEDATYGTSWDLMNTFSRLNKKTIIVGIECNHEGIERLKEFSPYSFIDKHYGYIEGYGKELFIWMINTLKPYIDNKYPTLSDRNHTLIGGSSMGGLMALYGSIRHSDVFAKAICVSPHIAYCVKDILKDIKRNKIDQNTYFYLSFGANELYKKYEMVDYINKVFMIQRLLEDKSHIYLHIFKGHGHNEKSWAKEAPTWIKELAI